MGDHCRSPVRRFFTIAQSPAAYTSGTLVAILSSTRIVPLNISMPVSCKKPVFGRMPMDKITTSAGSSPLSVSTPSALSSPVTPLSFVPVSTLIPFFSR